MDIRADYGHHRRAPFIVEYLYREQGKFGRPQLHPKTYNANEST